MPVTRPKGSCKPKGSGRQKGTPNKVTTALREQILQALDVVGGVDYLVDLARNNPASFTTLLGKTMPTQLSGTGKEGEIVITISGTDSRL
jgi:hypothetical protein